MSPMPSQSKSKFDLIRKLKKQGCLKRRTKDTTALKQINSHPTSKQVSVKQRNSNPTSKQVGRRIYDSILGVTCHWCRQKTVETHVKCWNCPIQYCGACLLNRNGEIIADEVLDEVKWTCPKCRGGCGDYCSNCCNCGPCRKSQGLGPTGQLKDTALRAGFSNAHDYLISLKTNEPEEVIALRKENRGWTKNTGGLKFPAGQSNDSERPNVGGHNFIDLTRCDIALQEEDSGNLGNSGNVPSIPRDTKEKSDTPKKDVGQITLSEALLRRRKVQGQEGSSPVKQSHGGYSPVPSQVISSPVPSQKSSSPTQIQNSSSTEQSQGGSRPQKKRPIQSTESQENSKHPRHGAVLERLRNRRLQKKSQVQAKNLQDLSFIEEEHNAYTGPYDFEEKLQAMNKKPFSQDRLQVLIRAMSRPRKKTSRLRETRNRSIEVSSHETGESYLDRHADIRELLSRMSDPQEKWKLLRSFFFWISHSCMEGAYKPWTKDNNCDDCCFIPGPYSQVDLIDLTDQDDEMFSSTPTCPSYTNVSKSYFDSAKVKKEKV